MSVTSHFATKDPSVFSTYRLRWHLDDRTRTRAQHIRLSNGAAAVHIHTGYTVRVAAHAMELAFRQPPAASRSRRALERVRIAGRLLVIPLTQRRNNARSSGVRSNPRNAAGIQASRRFDR